VLLAALVVAQLVAPRVAPAPALHPQPLPAASKRASLRVLLASLPLPRPPGSPARARLWSATWYVSTPSQASKIYQRRRFVLTCFAAQGCFRKPDQGMFPLKPFRPTDFCRHPSSARPIVSYRHQTRRLLDILSLQHWLAPVWSSAISPSITHACEVTRILAGSRVDSSRAASVYSWAAWSAPSKDHFCAELLMSWHRVTSGSGWPCSRVFHLAGHHFGKCLCFPQPKHQFYSGRDSEATPSSCESGVFEIAWFSTCTFAQLLRYSLMLDYCRFWSSSKDAFFLHTGEVRQTCQAVGTLVEALY
jgi:hypothetical protein